jgi:glutathionylspermidine amidase/synthetase
LHELSFPPEKFGTLLGHAPGQVAIYSSHYASVDPGEYPDRESFRSMLDGVYMGYKWQCVEFARRWLYLNHGYVFDDVPMAYDIFALHHVVRVADSRTLPLHSFANGCRRPPVPGCLLIWEEGGEFEVTGHVAIVTEVLPDRIRFAEQNVEHCKLPEGRSWSRELPVQCTPDGGYHVSAGYPDTRIKGWVVQTGDATHAEKILPSEPGLYRLSSRLAPEAGQHLRPWLDNADAAEAAFVSAMHGHRLTEAEDYREQYRYFRLSETAEQELRRATNELHLMFMHATQAVLQDDTLLQRFNIPHSLWPRLRRSWENRRGEIITGRFDFAVSEAGIKVYEYNADSASCYMEAGRVQGKWASHFGIGEGEDSGARLSAELTAAWAAVEVQDMLHILQDEDDEETYHAEYVRATAEAAGLSCRIIRGVEGLHWSDSGEVLDPEGVPIRYVWKTWAWETALDQIRAECEEEDARPRINCGDDLSTAPRLVDVLLRPEVMVYEPFWTLILSNKAMLPLLWQIFPDHPYLLASSYELTDDINSRGYVTKPIAGRCGSNISLFDRNDQLLKETSGNFERQEQIYQELWKLPQVGGYRAQVCTFAVRGRYAGSCVRVDKSLIITGGSELMPLRVVEDEAMLGKDGES